MKEEHEVVIRGQKYIQFINDDGRVSLKRFNQEYKMWVELTFTEDEEEDKEAREGFLQLLIGEYFKSQDLNLSNDEICKMSKKIL
ncbi:hypothetical protein [Paenibacillus thailandensis]|uniref:Uncharacterized protein n=1 Tax=Paenibacillus thailandensis TaxID=393250 RepID=A0ABW5R3V8_9BACL